jgi:hypothetical protein
MKGWGEMRNGQARFRFVASLAEGLTAACQGHLQPADVRCDDVPLSK